MAITISLCMIVKNEEAVLARCLDCAVQFADEIVIVDTGSGDSTIEIAKQYTEYVYHIPWTNDFASARNFSFSKASCDYILWLDADDIVDAQNIQKILELKERLSPDTDIVMFRYHTGFDESGAVTFSYYRERLSRRENNYRWREPVHEHLELWGNIVEADIAIIHGEKPGKVHSERNLRIYEGILEKGRELSTRGMYYYARELATHGRSEEAAAQFAAFLERPDGWVEDRINACIGRGDCLAALGKTDEALADYTRSFIFDRPRAEACCRMGRLLMGIDAARARFWYEFALQVPKPSGWGFLNEDDWGYVPHMQLCLLCDRAGETVEAFRHHLAARALKPDSPSVRHNEAYFAKLGEALQGGGAPSAPGWG